MAKTNGGWVMRDGIRPTVDELRDAIAKAKSHRGYTSTFIKHTDAGAAYVRSCLPARYHSLHCDEIRIAAQNLSRAGMEPGERTLTKEERSAKRFSNAVQAMVKAFPRVRRAAWQPRVARSRQAGKRAVRIQVSSMRKADDRRQAGGAHCPV